MCVIVPNVVPIGQTIAEISRFFELSKWLLSPSWIFEITNFCKNKKALSQIVDTSAKLERNSCSRKKLLSSSSVESSRSRIT